MIRQAVQCARRTCRKRDGHAFWVQPAHVKGFGLRLCPADWMALLRGDRMAVVNAMGDAVEIQLIDAQVRAPEVIGAGQMWATPEVRD